MFKIVLDSWALRFDNSSCVCCDPDPPVTTKPVIWTYSVECTTINDRKSDEHNVIFAFVRTPFRVISLTQSFGFAIHLWQMTSKILTSNPLKS